MATPDNNKLSEIVDMVKSWIPRRTEPANLSKDFWMPDQSCRVCYDCDSQFTIFNRKHHCRLCGRVFCAKCTENSIPVASDESKASREDWERIRVCNYCFKQWEQGITTVDNAMSASSPGLSPSPSATSLVSTQSTCTCNSSISSTGSTMYSTGPYKHVQCSTSQSPHQCAQMDPVTVKQDHVICSVESDSIDTGHLFPNQFGYCTNRSDDEDDVYGVYRSHSETRKGDVYCGVSDYNEFDHAYGPHELCPDGDNITTNTVNSDLLPDNFSTQGLEGIKKLGGEAKARNTSDECEPPLYDVDGTHAVPMDFENNRLLWLPPEPEEGEDERQGVLFDDDDDAEDFIGEWGYLPSSSSFRSEEYSNRDRSNEVHRKAMKNVVDGHFRALILQLLQVENLPVGEENNKESWLDIITSLSWEAATLLKPDTSKGGGMDPGGYVKIKCIACGRRGESMVVKGVVCKKNVAHRRMTSKIDKPRFLILGGALEYQRVANHLSSFDTLLQQEMDHLKMAVAKIDAHHPNVLLVEKSVSRFAQEYLLAKDISLVLNIKRPLLERIARCTGAQIVPSIDHLTSQKLGYCDSFHVEKFLEEHSTAGQGGKKLTKTLMFFEGCPKPLGCTILLKGASEDELKKVKHVVQYGVFAAYHLALETSFLADEGASLPELPLKSPITVALPDKPSSIDRSISTIPGFTIAAPGKLQGPQNFGEPYRSNCSLSSAISSSVNIVPSCKLEVAQPFLPKGPTSQTLNVEPAASSVDCSASVASMFPSGYDFSVTHQNGLSSNYVFEEKNNVGLKECSEAKTSVAKISEVVGDDNLVSNCFAEALGQGVRYFHSDGSLLTANCSGNSEVPSLKQDCNDQQEVGSVKDEFPPSPSNHQSILVSLSTRCVWKGTVCERAHLIRIKYYGSFDMPLGRFLRDNMFDKSYRCRSCEMPSEAHVHCYTHQQGSLTISVKKLPEFVLPGEREGKIWMWHRCLRCPRINGFPPATRRVVMSDAAWGLSFGKFLELSFSNHAAASRVANCGHSLHRDCLRFYGFGRMVACFRYASIDVHSVYLPPPKLEFNYANQGWIQKEADEVRSSADLLFAEVYNALHKIFEKISPECVMTSPESRQQIAEVEGMLQKEKDEFEASLQQVLNKDVNVGKPEIDILEINRLRKQLVFLSYTWDQRLINVASLNNCSLREGLSIFLPKLKEKPVRSCEKPVEITTTSKAGKGFSSCDSFLLDTRSEISLNQRENGDHINQADGVHKGRDTDRSLNYSLHTKETRHHHSNSIDINDQSDSLDPGGTVRRVLSEGRFPMMENLSDTLDAAWTGESHPSSITPQENDCACPNPVIVDSSTVAEPVREDSGLGNSKDDHRGSELGCSFGLTLPSKGANIMENSMSWVGMPFLKLYHSFNKNFSSNVQKLRTFGEYNPVYVLSFRELLCQGGARLLLPVGITDTVVPVYDDEPTSSIAYALVSRDYHIQISNEPERLKNGMESSPSLPILDAANLLSLNSFTEATSESLRSLGSTDESILSMSGSRGSSGLDPVLYPKSVHPRVSFTDEGPLGKVKYTVTCYYAKRFEALRRTCCPSELDFIRSLSRCKKWGAQGGKSNVFFAKTLDDRFIIKQVTKTELESFIKFALEYFKYLSESIRTGSPTCLAKILGIYQVTLKHLKGGKESRMDVLVMENLLFRRNITRLYDLKGSSRSRYNPDSSGSNKVLLDQNLIEAMPTSPIFVGNKAKRLLERAVWNDTAFLASADVMDYSLLVGVDEEKHELVLGIIDFMRQYTWDKHLETWVKASGFLGGPKNTSPTVISPMQYKKRFRKAMSAYFLMVPDQWSPPTIIPSRSQSDLCEDNSQRGTSFA